jgi:hypothetical protein
MKYFILTAALAFASTTAWAQEKQEATIKIVVDDNGKQKVIERHFSDISKAEGEIKKLSDSLDLEVKISGDVKKIIRMDVNKKARGNEVIIEREEGAPTPGQEKRVMIIRKGDKKGPMILEDMQGPDGMRKDIDIRIDGPRMAPQDFERIHGSMFADQASKTIHGLLVNPNRPFNGKLNVRFRATEKGLVTISVSDVEGKELAKEQIKDFEGNFVGQIDLKKASSGVYFVRVTLGNDGAVRRVKVD